MGKIFEGRDIQYCYREFLRIYKIGCETFIPKVDLSGNFKAKPKWLTSGMKSNMRKRLNLWHANKRSKWEDLRLVKEYKRLKGVCESEVKNAVKDYEKNIANNAKKNPKMVYTYMNSKKSSRILFGL